MKDKIIKNGISHGDINGVSYELILKVFEEIKTMETSVTVLYGHSKFLAFHRKAMDLQPVNFNTVNKVHDAVANRLNIINCGNDEIGVEFSKYTPETENMAREAIETALGDLKSANIDTLVFAPSTIDETAVLTEITGLKPLKILINDSLRIALATGKTPLAQVAAQISLDSLVEQLKTLNHSLIHDFMLTSPRIAVLSFNPGVGLKEQQFGKEESEIIVPAVKKANDAGLACFGPYSADDFFASDDYRKFDAILAMYHDQATAPFRLLSYGQGAAFFAGLPFVTTAPDLGPKFSSAGKNETDEVPLRQAIYLAEDIFANRNCDHEMRSNPLRRQYFEKGSDNEKLDLSRDDN